ncbi:MAG: hypothetical protein U0Q18_22010 [Bryobacteraceae bacterium]
MADFRRWFLALAVLVLVIGSVAPASAQATQSCNTTVVPPRMRAEGVTELIGDVLLNCTGTPTSTGTVNITVNLPNVPVTSRLTSTSVSGGGWLTDALVLIGEPVASGPDCGGVVVPGCAQTMGLNVFQGAWFPSDPNSITFLGVPVVAPGTTGNIIYRMTNIRANVSVMGVGPTAFVNLLGYVSTSPSTSLPVTNAQPIVGFVSWGMAFPPNPAGSTGVYAAGLPPNALVAQNFLQCDTKDTGLATIRFQEGFANAFKVRVSGDQSTTGLPAPNASESGLILNAAVDETSGAGSGLGLADYGTRLKATFTGLPAGITLNVANTNTCYSLSLDSETQAGCVTKAVLLTGSDAAADSGIGVPAAGTWGTSTAFPIDSTGTLTVVWEVVSSDQSAIEDFDFDLGISYTGNPSAGLPTVLSTPAQVALNFAPTIDELSSASPNPYSMATTGPIPRFVNVHNANAASLLTVSRCHTNLLFPYVTDFPGFDTGIAISNTAMDQFGTIPSGSPADAQAGACTVNFYGGLPDATTGFNNTAGNIGTSGVISSVAVNPFGGTGDATGFIYPGQTWAFAVSQYDPNYATVGFVGYAIAQCDFQYAHGYSFVSDYGLRNFAAAYLALVIPDVTPRVAAPFICASIGGCTPTGEQLVH